MYRTIFTFKNMELFGIRKKHGHTSPESGLINQRGTRTCLLSELALVVTSGHVDHSQLLVVVCEGLGRILEFLRYLVGRLCRARTEGRKDQWSVESIRTAKPLPDLLKDLPAQDTAHIARHPDILKVPDVTGHRLHRAWPGRAPYNSRGTFQRRLPSEDDGTFRSGMGGSVHETVGLSELPGMDGGRGGGAVAGRGGAGDATDGNSQCIEAIVVAIRSIGDNLDVAMRNHKEPVVQAAFRNAGSIIGRELLKSVRRDLVVQFIGASLKLLNFFQRL